MGPSIQKHADPDRAPASIEYHGVAGASDDCQGAVGRLIQGGVRIASAHIVTAGADHALLLTTELGDPIAIKTGFASGYRGAGPTALSWTLALLDAHRVEIEECLVDAALLERLDQSALSAEDLEAVLTSRPVRPSRWRDYIQARHFEQGRDGTLWREFLPAMPFSVLDARIQDLARDFWEDPDGRLNRGYRRLEDVLRSRIGSDESNTRIFAKAFTGETPPLGWGERNKSETEGRAQLFAAAFKAYRNPRAHSEQTKTDQLAEFLLLNQLFRLEAEAVEIETSAGASD